MMMMMMMMVLMAAGLAWLSTLHTLEYAHMVFVRRPSFVGAQRLLCSRSSTRARMTSKGSCMAENGSRARAHARSLGSRLQAAGGAFRCVGTQAIRASRVRGGWDALLDVSSSRPESKQKRGSGTGSHECSIGVTPPHATEMCYT